MHRISLYALFALLLLTSNSYAQAKSVRLATHNLAPYGYWTTDFKSTKADSRFQGDAVDMVRCAFAKIEENVQITVVPWQRAQALARYNAVDGFFAASQRANRDEFAQLSETIAEQTWTWYFLQSSAIKPSSKGFKQRAKVSSFRGANMQKWLKSHQYRTSTAPVDSSKLLSMLLAKRYDAILVNDLVMAELLKTHPKADLLESEPLKSKPLGVYFTKQFLAQEPSFLTRFNQAVLECRKGQS